MGEFHLLKVKSRLSTSELQCVITARDRRKSFESVLKLLKHLWALKIGILVELIGRSLFWDASFVLHRVWKFITAWFLTCKLCFQRHNAQYVERHWSWSVNKPIHTFLCSQFWVRRQRGLNVSLFFFWVLFCNWRFRMVTVYKSQYTFFSNFKRLFRSSQRASFLSDKLT